VTRGQQALLHRRGDGGLARAHVQLAADVADMKIGGPFADAQDAADFPTGLALRGPIKTILFALGQQMHVTVPVSDSLLVMKINVSKCIIALRADLRGLGKH
jgi:hypothetical protein